MADAAKQPLDPVFSSIGDAGKYQIIILLLISASKLPVGWQQLSSVFLAPQVDKHCNVPNNTTDICSPQCTEVWYDRSVFKQTITMEWDLICDKKNWDKYGQTIFMFGILLGNIIFGIWADKKGRIPPLMWSIVLQLISGCLAAIAPWYWLFVFLRFLCALATGGNMLTTFCLLMEIIGPSKREFLIGIIYQIPFNIGHLTLPLFAYFTKHFRWYQFSFSIYSVLLLSYFFTIPESPRWLVLSGQTDRAVKILEKAAEFNGQSTERIRQNCEDAVRAREAQGQVKKGNLFDLLRTPNLRKYSLCIFYNWFAVGFNYFGVSQYIGSLGGNIFVNITISGLFSVPGVVLSVLGCKYLGRKPTLIIADFAIGLSMLLFIFVPDSMNTAKVALSSVSVFGCALLFPTCYLVAAEIFPTQARNSGMGTASMLARIGAMIAANAGILEELIKWMPPLVFSLIAFVAMFLSFLLPETFGHSLPETCEDAENYGKKS